MAKTTEPMAEAMEGGIMDHDRTEDSYVIEADEKKIVFCKNGEEYKKYIQTGVGKAYEFKERRPLGKGDKLVFIALILNDGGLMFIRANKNLFKPR